MGQRKFKKNNRVFVPCVIPRYLPGSVHRQFNELDLKNYNNHRYNIFMAAPFVDCTPPLMNPYNYINLRKFQEDAERLKFVEKENKNLIQRINIINRTKGAVDCWTKPEHVRNPSKWKKHANEMNVVVAENKEIFQRIIRSTPVYKKKDQLIAFAEHRHHMRGVCKYPLRPLFGKNIDQILEERPSIGDGKLPSFTRHRVFLEFSIVTGTFETNLGRAIIELYEDHAPVTSKNFLELCRGHTLSYKNCKIHRTVKDKYFETGDIICGNGKGGMSYSGNNFQEEENDLKHTKQGVVSMIRVERSPVPMYNSQFSITFKEMPELDGKRLVFGKVIRGNDTICKINDTSRKNGAPLEKILITNCGEV